MMRAMDQFQRGSEDDIHRRGRIEKKRCTIIVNKKAEQKDTIDMFQHQGKTSLNHS